LISWFGRIAHSDLAPYIDDNGGYILDEEFNRYVESLSPAHNVHLINGAAKVHMFTNALDDRIDQTLATEAGFARQVKCNLVVHDFNITAILIKTTALGFTSHR
jgi:hypothetical protein